MITLLNLIFLMNLSFAQTSNEVTRDFWNEDAFFVLIRRQRFTSSDTHLCVNFKRVVSSLPLFQNGRLIDLDFKQLQSHWGALTLDELDEQKKCTDFPCLVKFDKSEVLQMKKASEAERPKRFIELVLARTAEYMKTGVRKEFEFEGAPKDPLKFFEKKDIIPPLDFKVVPGRGELRSRIFDFAPGKLKRVRQILDFHIKSWEQGSWVYIQDVYSDHYFDGWSEVIKVECQKSNEVALTHGLFIEMDPLKQTDIFSRISRPRVRSATQDRGESYLDQSAEFIRERSFESGPPR